MKFCDYNIHIKEGIVNALKHTFYINDISLLEEQYLFFKSCFSNVNSSIDYQTPYLLRHQVQPKTAATQFIEKYNNPDYCLGIDLPIYLSHDANRKNVVIVAEDPLRDVHDEHITPILQHAVLSTPFATHLDSCRRKLKEYWDFHQTLVSYGYNVYITDINKIWLKKVGGSKETIPSDLTSNFTVTLQSEIDLMKADIVITYGRKSASALQNMELDLKEKVVNFIHPSKAANGSWKKLFMNRYPGEDRNCSSANKVEYMINTLNELALAKR